MDVHSVEPILGSIPVALSWALVSCLGWYWRVTLSIDFRLTSKYRRTFGSIPVARESNVRAKREPLYERVTGIEPAWPAWKAGALPLSYTRVTNVSIGWNLDYRIISTSIEQQDRGVA